MADLGPLWPAVGGAAVVLAREIWSWLRSRRSPEEIAAKDKTIAVLEAENARLKRDLWNARKEADDERRRLQEWTDRTVGVAARMRMDSQVDESEFEPDLPTEVRQRVELVAPRASLHPAGIPDKRNLPPGAGHADYDGIDVAEITPTALAKPFPPGRRG